MIVENPFSEMKWGSPGLLHLLWLLPPLGWALFALAKRRASRLGKMVADSTWAALIPGWRPENFMRRSGLWIAAVGALTLALARPQYGFHMEEVRRNGLDIIVCMDTSKSMLTEDIKPNRIEQAKFGVRDMLKQLKGDRVGLVAFAGAAFLQCPLTVDYSAFAMMLDDVRVGLIPRGGTDISGALQTAMESFEKRNDADKAIILVTDGEDTDADPTTMVDELKNRGIRVFAVGVGSLEGELIPITDEQGHAGFLKDSNGQVVKSRLDEGRLSQLALKTGGAYVRAAPGDLGLDRILSTQLSLLKRSQADTKMIRSYEDRFGWLVALALALLAVEAGLSDRRNVSEVKP